MNNNLVPYKENIFIKISNFFKRLFSRKKKVSKEEITEQSVYINNTNNQKENFIEQVVIPENQEEKRLRLLKLKFDKGEIDEEDISDEDIEKIVEMYEKETEKLNADTERIKANIEKMLKELKAS